MGGSRSRGVSRVGLAWIGLAVLAGAALGQTATYIYDSLNRLTSATINGSRIEYEYDAAGNIVRVVTPYAISVALGGTGAGVVTDDLGKVNCGSDCSGVYDLNALVTLTAIPDVGTAFVGWSGDCTGTGPCVITVTGIGSVTASFAAAADLSVSKTDGLSEVAPGEVVTYTIGVSNAGPSAVPGAGFSDPFPASLSCTWTSVTSGGASGSAGGGAGAIAETLTLPPGSAATYTASCAVDPAASGVLSNTATVSSGIPDTNPGDESATDTTTLVPEADLGVSVTDGVSTVTPGEAVIYTIAVANAGPSTVTDAAASDLFPAELSCTWTSLPAGGASGSAGSGSGSIAEVLTLPPASSMVYTASCSIDPAATGILANSASVTSSTFDPSPGNETSTDTSDLVPEADLAVTKSDGVATATPGDSVTYLIDVTNSGPSAVTDAAVSDPFPAALDCSWVSAPAGGASGSAGSGSGSIGETLTLPPGGSMAYTVDCAIDPAATGVLSNTASVSTAVTDTNPGNEVATDTTDLLPAADLSVTKSDGLAAVAPGEPVTYVIAVSSGGPSSVTDALVSDAFPAILACSWTSTAAGGASGSSGTGSGSISEVLALPPGSSMTYVADCTVDQGATGILSNTASVATVVPDTNPGDETATDTTTLVPVADHWVVKTAADPEIGLGGTEVFTVEVGNSGPSNAVDLVVVDTLPSEGTFQSAAGDGWSCLEDAGIVTCDRALLAAGESSQILVTMEMPATAGVLVNEASVSSAIPEAAPGDEVDSATVEVFAAPKVTEVTTVAATETGTLEVFAVTSSGITQIHLQASHELEDPPGDSDPHDVTNPACYRLFLGSVDDPYPPGTCQDPSDVPIDSVSYSLAGPDRIALAVGGGWALSAGRYRLLACGSGAEFLRDVYGNALDGDGDGTPGDDFEIPFQVRVTNLLENPNFDEPLDGWTILTQVPGDVTHDATMDAAGAATSGSARFVNFVGAGASSAILQCVAVEGGESYRAGGRLRTDSLGPVFPEHRIMIAAIDGPACTGTVLGSETSAEWAGDTGTAWVSGAPIHIVAPPLALSARIVFRVFGDEIAAESWLDDRYVFNELVFRDGFESGDTIAWSETVAGP